MKLFLDALVSSPGGNHNSVAWTIYRHEGALMKVFSCEVASDRSPPSAYKGFTPVEPVLTPLEAIRYLQRDLKALGVRLMVGFCLRDLCRVFDFEGSRSGPESLFPGLRTCCLRQDPYYHSYTPLDLGYLYEDLFGSSLRGPRGTSISAKACAKCFFDLRRDGRVYTYATALPYGFKLRKENNWYYGIGITLHYIDLLLEKRPELKCRPFLESVEKQILTEGWASHKQAATINRIRRQWRVGYDLSC